ncbi:DUF4288 domain-containing protein [Neobacillus sp. MER 74]|uniref:DUF4288 domain-containing protein n=1 Tax=Neobacillus sp. MER 74 TaxID=2939566 RepID=UPI0020416105|nr:DUF4288 domain-containing protein [Neobacillus sp. MER 74]MCM3118845.1 DUF4288 domain-containing protein [Neobacillus sp. MER 74]
MKKSDKRSSWEWYAVKLLYECIITGKPNPETIDENYTDAHKTYEESIMLVKAQSFEHAYSIAEKKAKNNEIDHLNPYEERVQWQFVDTVDCFIIIDDLETGAELYSRFLRVPKNIPKEEVICHYYPETVEDDEIDRSFILRNRDFNKRPNS